MKRLAIIVLPLLALPMVGLVVLAWSLAGHAEDRIVAAERGHHADLIATFESRLDASVAVLSAVYREWADDVLANRYRSAPHENESWTVLCDEQERWWYPRAFATHRLAVSAFDVQNDHTLQRLTEAAALERADRSGQLALEKYRSLDEDTVPSVIRGRALLGPARCLRRREDLPGAIDVYRRMADEFVGVVDETGMNLGAEAGSAHIALAVEAKADEPARPIWRRYVDRLVSGEYPMMWPLRLAHVKEMLAVAPPDPPEQADADRMARLRSELTWLQQAVRCLEAVRQNRELRSAHFVALPQGRRIAFVQPIRSDAFNGWVLAGFDEQWILHRLLEPILTELNQDDRAAAFVRDDTSRVVLGRAIAPEGVTREMSLARRGLPWTLGVGFSDLTGLHARATRRHVLLTGSIGVLTILLIAGAVLAGRMVRREIELSELKSQFVDNVSHELRTPITSIKLFAEMLRDDKVPDAERKLEYYRLLASESDRLSRMVENMLDFSRIVAGRVHIRREPTDVAEFLQGLRRHWRLQARQTGHRVQLNLADDLPECDIDREAVARSIANLVSNAIKYSPDAPEVTVTARRRDDTVSIAVRDRGVGIPPEDLERVFDRFYRVKNPQADHVQGTGLGLTIVKDTAERHGGQVRIDSRPGQGTVVELLLPVQRGDPEPCSES